jgi:membrane peptidoglycan carboxypeptidase
MNPYDDEEPSYRSRSHSSRADRYGRDDDYGDHRGGGRARDQYDGYSEPTTRSVSSGRASVGRASVSGSARPVAPEEPVYGAPYGDAAYGSSYGESGNASSGRSSGYGSHSSASHDPYGSAPTSPPGPNPVSPARGVGRAQVRPISPSSPPGLGGGGAGPGGPGGRGPGGWPPVPGAPGGEGPGGYGPEGPEGAGGRRPFRGFGLASGLRRRTRGAGDPKDLRSADRKRKAKIARIRNISISAAALLVILAGGGFVAGTLFFDSVQVGDVTPIPETSTIYYNDGKTVLAHLGESTHFVVNYDDMSPYVTEAIIASEDNTFWTNQGVEFSAVVRAAWNNVTGGQTQGASTITQQYARLAFDMREVTFNRKIREAVLAWKMSDKMSKTDILSGYLNLVEFGRQTYGAEAAARAFFGASIMKNPPAPYKKITRSQAMALVAMVKQPYPDPIHPDTKPGYDPTRGEAAKNEAIGRWDYVRKQLEDLSKADPGHFTLTPEEDATLAFPADAEWLPEKQDAGLDSPAGLVVNHVLGELTNSDNPNFKGMTWQDIKDGGYNIVTTLDVGAQKAAEDAADGVNKTSPLYGQPSNLQGALVAVEPGTGRVVAYYGGHKGSGNDYAGIYLDENGQPAGVGGRHPPGSSFKVYTLSAALRAGYSLNSYWQWTPHAVPGRASDNPFRNAEDCDSDLMHNSKGQLVHGKFDQATGLYTYTDPTTGIVHVAGSSSHVVGTSGLCSLFEALTHSLNIPFIDVTVSVGPNNVLEMAHEAGIRFIWNNDLKRIDLDSETIDQAMGDGLGIEVGIGQYSITPLEHANGVATMAAGGHAATEHFVKEVNKDGKKLYGETLPNPNAQPILPAGAVDDLTYAMSKVKNINIGGFEAATKTGTWQYQDTSENAHAWNVGFTSKLAAVVWVGNKDKEQPIKDKSGTIIYGSYIPRNIWTQFMNAATDAMKFPKDHTQFDSPKFIGDENPPGSFPSPTPPVPTLPPTVQPTESVEPSGTVTPTDTATATPSTGTTSGP